MHRNSRFRVRLLLLTVLALVPILGIAQDVLAPKWISYGAEQKTWNPWSVTPSYSRDGTRVLLPREGNFSVCEADSGKMLCHVELPGIRDACFSSDGKDVYLVYFDSYTYNIVKYNVATGNRTTLPGISENTPITYIDSSKDGTKLVYSTTGAKGWFHFHIYDLINGIQFSTFDGFGSMAKFIDNDSKLALCGPAIYDVSGALIRTNSGMRDLYTKFDVSPDESKMVCIEYIKGITLYSMSDLSLIWSRAPNAVPIISKFTADGKAILYTTYPIHRSNYWGVGSVAVATGIINPKWVGYQIPFQKPLRYTPCVTVSPTSGHVLVGPTVVPRIDEFTVDSVTGAFDLVKRFADGNTVALSIYPSTLNFISFPKGGEAETGAFHEREHGAKHLPCFFSQRCANRRGSSPYNGLRSVA